MPEIKGLLYTVLRTDSNGNTKYNPIINEQKQIVNGVVVLNELPYNFDRVVVNNPDMVEIDISQPITNVNQYKVAYNNPNGMVFFHTDRNGQTMSFNYTGMGLVYIDSSRVVTLYENGTIKETLESLISGVREIQAVYDAATHENTSVELTQARVNDISNITYDNLRERLDTEYSYINNKIQEALVVSDIAPISFNISTVWYEVKGEGNSNTGDGLVVDNAITSDDEPSNSYNLWFDPT